ncbi:hypothetical protein FZC84_21480 [Rossellomorea vietnamensis]|uniref:Lipoprotein n=1 Tax=Rossellomorea vietnamensis TaxID=218284 RepID=A0A5D4M1W1_9BACI|nr:hypothetical protein [Rossellomorea vietnamensis]TYR95531.1 hypothetical protein FZC84_21480 [Rossellomorea vietnamensis]
MRTLIVLLLGCLLLSGCASEGSGSITVEERKGEEQYEEIFKVKDSNEVIEFLDNLRWQTETQVMMQHLADYRFTIPDSGEEGDWRYYVWITPDGDQLEMTRDSDQSNDYIKVSEEDSQYLFKVLTGESL